MLMRYCFGSPLVPLQDDCPRCELRRLAKAAEAAWARRSMALALVAAAALLPLAMWLGAGVSGVGWDWRLAAAVSAAWIVIGGAVIGQYHLALARANRSLRADLLARVESPTLAALATIRHTHHVEQEPVCDGCLLILMGGQSAADPAGHLEARRLGEDVERQRAIFAQYRASQGLPPGGAHRKDQA